MLMAVVAGFSFCAGLYFFILGAWPVSAFFAANLLALFGAFKRNYRDALLVETIHLEDKLLHIQRIVPSGQAASWKFNPYWVRLNTKYDDDGCTELALTSHGKTLVIGAFLGPDVRARFAAALQIALVTHRA